MYKINTTFRQYSQIIYPLLFFLTLAAGCQNSGRQSDPTTGNALDGQYTEAIRSIIAGDEKLGAIRNHTCEDTSLAEAVRQYVAGIDALDFSRCPEDFTLAFQQHRDAWETSIALLKPFDEMRGEMHELFALIEQGDERQQATHNKIMQPIMDTWAKVDSLAGKYGALSKETIE